MARQRSRRDPAALVLGGSSPLLELLARVAPEAGVEVARFGGRVTPPAVALITVSDPHAPELLAAAARLGLPVLLELDPAAAFRGQRLVDEAPVGTGLAVGAAWSPFVQRAGEEIAGLGALDHVSVQARQPADRGDPLVTAVALGLWAFPTSDPIGVVRRADGWRIDLDGNHEVLLDTGIDRVPQWSIQAASTTSVVRAEWAPIVSLERDGTALAFPRPVDPAQAALELLGVLGMVADARTGRLADPATWPAGARPGWLARVAAVLGAMAAAPDDAGVG